LGQQLSLLGSAAATSRRYGESAGSFFDDLKRKPLMVQPHCFERFPPIL
jgi:hypothetical protein